jgi:hypothetical protein
MKASVLILRGADGSLRCEVAESAVGLAERAKRIRVAGEHDGVPVHDGVVASVDPLRIQYRFRCEAKTEATGNPSPDSAPATRGRRGRG